MVHSKTSNRILQIFFFSILHRRHTHIRSLLHLYHSAVRRPVLRGADRTPARPDCHHGRPATEHAAYLLHTDTYPRRNVLYNFDSWFGLFHLRAAEGRRGRRTQPAVSWPSFGYPHLIYPLEYSALQAFLAPKYYLVNSLPDFLADRSKITLWIRSLSLDFRLNLHHPLISWNPNKNSPWNGIHPEFALKLNSTSYLTLPNSSVSLSSEMIRVDLTLNPIGQSMDSVRQCCLNTWPFYCPLYIFRLFWKFSISYFFYF